MYSIKNNFDKILRLIKDVLGAECPETGNLLRPGPKPTFTDLEVIALSITAESLSLDSENRLFVIIKSEYTKDFPNIISRRQYNDRRKLLFNWQELIRNRLAGKLNEITEVYAVDSMPLEICKMARMGRNNMGKEEEYLNPEKGYCASQDRWYYGYKLHAACSPTGVIQSMDMTAASVHDNHYLLDISSNYRNCIMAGDKGYIVNPSDNKALALKEAKVCMEIPYRNNQKDKKPVLYILKVIRKRIETVFSHLCDQFLIQRNYAKSFMGYKTRILAKVSGLTMLQYINKFITGKPVGQVKYALCY